MSRKNALAIVAAALTFLIVVSAAGAGEEPTPTPSLKDAIVKPALGMLCANVALVLFVAFIGAIVLWREKRKEG